MQHIRRFQRSLTDSAKIVGTALGSDGLSEGFYLTPEPIIAGQSSLDLLAGVHDGRMIFSAERLADGRQRRGGHGPAEVHRHLSDRKSTRLNSSHER